LLACSVAISPLQRRLSAQKQGQFLFVNDDMKGNPNMLEGFAVSSSGALTPLRGSPYMTGGTGLGGGFWAIPRIAVVSRGNFLFVSNAMSSTISVFQIDPVTGIPRLEGAPVPTGGSGACQGLGLAPSPDSEFLYVGNSCSMNISAFAIGSDGGLTPLQGSPFATASYPNGIKVTPDGKFLLATQGYSPNVTIAVFSIEQTGELTQVPGSPFVAQAAATSVDINCSSDRVFIGDANYETSIEVYSLSPSGTLTSPIPGSPFTFHSGADSQNVYLGLNSRVLYLSNEYSASITVLRVAPDGSLQEGHKFSDGEPGGYPAGQSSDPAGHFLFVGNARNLVSVLRATSEGRMLVPAPGSPFHSEAGSVPLGVAAFPTKTCRP
jgi:6-phosphogluconolactonase (cycloisomerase 2 family)